LFHKHLKSSKVLDSPPLPLETATRALAAAAVSRGAEPRLHQRLAEIQAVLGDDMARVEIGLREALADGVEPAGSAARHLVLLGGKRVRPLALLLSAACFGPVTPVARELAVVAELIHSATLLHDDVVDEGTERRGAKAARCLFGNGVSVLAGDMLLVDALDRTLQRAPEVLADLIGTLRLLVQGEIIQMRGRTELDVSEHTYERILREKTASLFGWATCTGARVAGAGAEEQERLRGFGERLGIAFQLVDDVLDYSGAESGKTLLTDLREGKLTLPLVLAVQRHPELLELLRRIHAGDHEPVAFVSRTVTDCGVCDEVRYRATRYTESAVDALRSVAPGPARALLEQVAYQLAQRAA
jgi:octaprenyl-diphosphate synthase